MRFPVDPGGVAWQDMAKALEERGHRDTPVILTSAISRLGRDEMWRYLRLAVLKPDKHAATAAANSEGPGDQPLWK